MKLKRVLAGVLAATTVLALTGCTPDTGNSGSGNSNSSNTSSSDTQSGTGTNSGTTSGDASEPEARPELEGGIQVDKSKIKEGMKLTVYTNRTDRVKENEGGNGYFEKMVKPFEERYGCTVEFIALKQYDDDIKTLLSGKDYGDVLNIPGSGIRPTALADYFEPLGSVEDLSKAYQWSDQKAVDGVCFGLATGGNASGICYNKKVWEQAGITSDNLPKTIDDFIADLKKIKENTNAIPAALCFNDAKSWILKEYTQFAVAASGDPEYKTKLLTNKEDLFVEGKPYYEMVRWMYEMYKDPDLHELDVNTTQWEQCKPLLGQGKIGTFIVSSWAYSQFRAEAEKSGADPNDVGFMPLPFTTEDGKQHSLSGPDTNMAVNKNISDDKKELAKAFIKWWIEESTYARDEGFLETLQNSEMPDSLEGFSDVVFFEEKKAPKEIEKVWDNVDNKSLVGVDKCTGDNYKTEICELALKGEDEAAFKAVLERMNRQWAEARDKDEDLAAYLAANG